LDALWFYAIGFITIWVIAILFHKKLKIDIEGPLLMRRTKKLRGFIDGIAQRSPRFWKWTMNIGVPLGFFFMFLMLYLLVISLETLLEAPSVAIILPGVDLPGQPIAVPLGYGIIGLATVMIVHEFGHGILARAQGVRIKSIGVLLLAVLPGAFVEPDEDEVKKLNRISKLRFYVAGSISNFILAAFSLIIILGISLMFISGLSFGLPFVSMSGDNSLKSDTVWLNISGPVYPTFHIDGVRIDSVVPASPAEGVLQEGMVIKSINGKPTGNSSQYLQALNGTKIGDALTFQTDKGTFTIKTVASPNNASKSYIGLRSEENKVVNADVYNTWGNSLPWVIFTLQDLFYWIFVLNFLVGLFNLLPMKPLDGGLMFEELLRSKISEKNVRLITYPLSVFIISIIIVSVIYGTGRGIAMLF
jgi:membrane-associated protease RseP (regulator of RpoE activity)